AYDAVAAWLAGTAPAPPRVAAVPGLDAQLRLQDRVAQAMKELRHRRGALDLETIEPRAVFDGDVLTDLLPDERNRARELIEDFMIAANGVTAKFLEARGFRALRRVLRAPERWERIVALAAERGDRLRPAPYTDAELAALARHCTEAEDNAAKVERQVRKSAAALLLASRIGERFDAIITGAGAKGTWVRVLQPPVEGKVVRGVERLDVG